jgi:hypothetical protein
MSYTSEEKKKAVDEQNRSINEDGGLNVIDLGKRKRE